MSNPILNSKGGGGGGPNQKVGVEQNTNYIHIFIHLGSFGKHTQALYIFIYIFIYLNTIRSVATARWKSTEEETLGTKGGEGMWRSKGGRRAMAGKGCRRRTHPNDGIL